MEVDLDRCNDLLLCRGGRKQHSLVLLQVQVQVQVQVYLDRCRALLLHCGARRQHSIVLQLGDAESVPKLLRGHQDPAGGLGGSQRPKHTKSFCMYYRVVFFTVPP